MSGKTFRMQDFQHTKDVSCYGAKTLLKYHNTDLAYGLVTLSAWTEYMKSMVQEVREDIISIIITTTGTAGIRNFSHESKCSITGTSSSTWHMGWVQYPSLDLKKKKKLPHLKMFSIFESIGMNPLGGRKEGKKFWWLTGQAESNSSGHQHYETNQ